MYPIYIMDGCALLDPSKSCEDFEVSYDSSTRTTTTTLHRDVVLGSSIEVKRNLVLNLNGHAIDHGDRNWGVAAISLSGYGIRMTINGEEPGSSISAPGYAVRSSGMHDALEINGGRYSSRFRAIEWCGSFQLDIKEDRAAVPGGPVTIRDADIQGDSLGIHILWLTDTVAEITGCRLRGGVSFSADDSSLTVRDTEFRASESLCGQGLAVWGERTAAVVSGCTLHDGCRISNDAKGGSLTVTDTRRYDRQGKLVERGS